MWSMVTIAFGWNNLNAEDFHKGLLFSSSSTQFILLSAVQ